MQDNEKKRKLMNRWQFLTDIHMKESNGHSKCLRQTQDPLYTPIKR